MNGLGGRKVLVTGATGFIGGRLIEKLILGEGANVRALVSSYSRCARIARFPVELHRADLLDPGAVTEAAQGCEVIYHCAYGSRGTPDERRRVTVEGTRNVIRAAQRSGARLVHLSTQMVYGVPSGGTIDEETPRQKSGGTYADSKIEAEQMVLEAADDGIAATVLQPTAVYGPYAPVWTVGVLKRMSEGRVPLIAQGEGTCNAVYVDDVVDAMLLASFNDAAVGEAFLVSAAQPVTWREFYGSFEGMLGIPATVPVADDEVEQWQRPGPGSLLSELPQLLKEPTVRKRLGGTVEGRFLRKLARPLLARRKPRKSATPELERLKRLRESEEPAVQPLAASDVRFFASTARVRIDKARRILGYRPVFDLEQGMQLTGEWARWAGLVPRTSYPTAAPAGEGVSS